MSETKIAPTDKVYKNTDVVTFKVTYPKEYKKKKHLKEGSVHKLHVLHAERLESKGIGQIVK